MVDGRWLVDGWWWMLMDDAVTADGGWLMGM